MEGPNWTPGVKPPPKPGKNPKKSLKAPKREKFLKNPLGPPPKPG